MYIYINVYTYTQIYLSIYLSIYLHIYIYLYISISLHIYIFKIYGEKNIIYLKSQISLKSSFQKPYQCEIKLQTKTQITQQHNKSKLKNTYSIKEMTIKGKI